MQELQLKIWQRFLGANAANRESYANVLLRQNTDIQEFVPASR